MSPAIRIYEFKNVFPNTRPYPRSLQYRDGEFEGQRIARNALIDIERGAQVLTAYTDDYMFLGAASFRIVGGNVKRINTGVLVPRAGVGTALVRAICQRHPDKPQFTKSVQAAWPFCEALGMHHAETLDDGRRIYRWTADQVAAFAGEAR